MKRLLLLTAACCIINVSKAQITKGSTMIGGYLGYYYDGISNLDSSITNKNVTNNYYFGINYAKCFKENTFWGVTGSISFSEIKSSSNSNVQSTFQSQQRRNFNLGVFERKYYPIISNLFVFYQAGIGLNINNQTYSSLLNSNNGYGINLYALPGISYKVSKKIFLEADLSNLINIDYAHLETNNPNTYTRNTFSSTIQLPTQILQNLNVGMTVIIGK